MKSRHDPEEEAAMMDRTYTVTGMTCGHCVNAVSSEVSAITGVQDVAVDLDTGTVTVRGEGFTDDEIRAAVDEAGYAVVDA